MKKIQTEKWLPYREISLRGSRMLGLQFTRAIRNTIECTLREHSIVMNRIFDAFRCFAAPFAHKKARVNCRIQKEPLHFAMALCYVLD